MLVAGQKQPRSKADNPTTWWEKLISCGSQSAFIKFKPKSFIEDFKLHICILVCISINLEKLLCSTLRNRTKKAKSYQLFTNLECMCILCCLRMSHHFLIADIKSNLLSEEALPRIPGALLVIQHLTEQPIGNKFIGPKLPLWTTGE